MVAINAADYISYQCSSREDRDEKCEFLIKHGVEKRLIHAYTSVNSQIAIHSKQKFFCGNDNYSPKLFPLSSWEDILDYFKLGDKCCTQTFKRCECNISIAGCTCGAFQRELELEMS